MIKIVYCPPDYLEHHGIKGMKWGVRRFQNYDGSRIDKAADKMVGNAGDIGGSGVNRKPKGFFAKRQEQFNANKAKREAERAALERKKRLQKERENFSRGGWTDAYNKAANKQNEDIARINKKYENVDLGWKDSEYVEDMVSDLTDDGIKYLQEMDAAWQKNYDDAIRSTYSPELVDEFMQSAPMRNEYRYLIETAENSRKKKQGR